MLDLKEEFDIFNEIGRGNFAKVHICSRKNDNIEYALKTIEKS